jgi:hypothetical protein
MTIPCSSFVFLPSLAFSALFLLPRITLSLSPCCLASKLSQALLQLLDILAQGLSFLLLNSGSTDRERRRRRSRHGPPQSRPTRGANCGRDGWYHVRDARGISTPQNEQWQTRFLSIRLRGGRCQECF